MIEVVLENHLAYSDLSGIHIQLTALQTSLSFSLCFWPLLHIYK